METTQISRNQIINQILHIGHGNLSIYMDAGLKAVRNEPELFAHLIAWNQKNGSVRDSKKALPVIAMQGPHDEELFENAAAHLCLLSPMDLLSAYKFHRTLPPNDFGPGVRKAIHLYIRERERSRAWWDRTALQHRKALKGLYCTYHIKPGRRAQKVLFEREYPAGSVFAVLPQLRYMNPVDAAGAILEHRVPFLIARGALGGFKDKPDLLLALMEQMSPAEIITNTKSLEGAGVFESPMLKAAYDAALARGRKAKKKPDALKAGKAAKHVAGTKAAKVLKETQEQALDDTKGIEGDWLVLGDRSGSMDSALELSRQVAAVIARMVKGKVYLVLFNHAPDYFDVSDMTLEEIQHVTRRYNAMGATCIGCGVELLADKNIVVNGIAVCTDGGENRHPAFCDAYESYAAKMGINPTVYMYHVNGETDRMTGNCQRAGVSMERFELGGGHVDYYSLPNIVKTMRTSKYSLVEEIMDTPLLTFNQVFKKEGLK